MGGICGIVRFHGATVAPEELEAMLTAVPYRARDGVGRWIEGSAGFACQATEVGMPEERSEQPYVDEEAGLVLVAHARLDNRDELCHILNQAGVLRTRVASNPELILGAYKQWGIACAEKIAGDFAIAVWDSNRQHLFAARDPMAMRPFYYHCARGTLSFASEVKQLLTLPAVKENVREEAIARYLAGHPEDLSGSYFEDVDQLPPASAVLVTRESKRTWRYWDLDPHRRIRYKQEEEYVEHFRELLVEATRVRFRSPQPAGLLLSGGLDSGAVASVAGVLKQKGELECPDLHTYSWAFPTLPECDEREVSDVIASHFGFPTTYIDTDEYAPLKTYPEYAPDPADPNMGVFDPLLTAGFQQAHRDGVGYMFTGHRGDLVVGDWNFNYLELFYQGRWVTLLRALRSHHRLLAVTPRHTWRRYFLNPIKASVWPRDRLPQIRAAARGLWHTLQGTTDDSSSFPPWMPASLTSLLPPYPEPQPVPEGLRAPSRKERYRLIMNPGHMYAAMINERNAAMHRTIAVDVWTDRRLLEFALAVPQEVLCRAGENKRVLRLALRGIMPEPARRKAGKTYPSPLYNRSLKRHRELVLDMLFDRSVSARYGYLDEEELRTHYEAFLEGEPYDYRIWYPITLEMWLRTRSSV